MLGMCLVERLKELEQERSGVTGSSSGLSVNKGVSTKWGVQGTDTAALASGQRTERQTSLSPTLDIDSLDDSMPQPIRIQGEAILNHLTPPPPQIRRYTAQYPK